MEKLGMALQFEDQTGNKLWKMQKQKWLEALASLIQTIRDNVIVTISKGSQVNGNDIDSIDAMEMWQRKISHLIRSNGKTCWRIIKIQISRLNNGEAHWSATAPQ